MGWRPGVAPIGYVKRVLDVVRDIALDIDHAPLIKEMFELSVLLHQSGRTIKDLLDSIDFRTKTYCPLLLNQIYRVQTNPFYYDYFEYPAGGPLFKEKHKPIIAKELFDKVRARMDQIVPEKLA